MSQRVWTSEKNPRASARWGSPLLSLLSFRLCVQCKASRLPGFSLSQGVWQGPGSVDSGRWPQGGSSWRWETQLSLATWPWGPWRFSSLAFTPPQSSCSKLFISEKTNMRVSPPPPLAAGLRYHGNRTHGVSSRYLPQGTQSGFRSESHWSQPASSSS